jgi:hypothetical protein
MTEQMPEREYRKAIERRFIELGRQGANADTKHPGRRQWVRLRDEILAWDESKMFPFGGTKD